MKDLAIVIPAYKPEFFAQALESISNQTCKDFVLYIGDDASPYDLYSIVKEYETNIEIVYKRFDENVGGRNLVEQWERCIALSKNEEWIWLFSDDDVMDKNCVESFYNKVNCEEFDLCRFDLKLIDDNNNITGLSCYPELESVIDYIKSRNNFEKSSAVTNYIFSRSIYLKENGFEKFPLAWCSDDATWFKFGREKGIFTINGTFVSWRNSSENISNNNKDFKLKKIKAQIQFLSWLYDFNIFKLNTTLFIGKNEFRKFSYRWLFLITIQLNLSLFQSIYFSKLVSNLYQSSFFSEFFFFYKKNISNKYEIISVFYKPIKKITDSISR